MSANPTIDTSKRKSQDVVGDVSQYTHNDSRMSTSTVDRQSERTTMDQTGTSSLGVPAQQAREEMTSFGFLQESSDSHESGFGFGHIFSRVRSAFTTSGEHGGNDTTEHNSRLSAGRPDASGSIGPRRPTAKPAAAQGETLASLDENHTLFPSATNPRDRGITAPHGSRIQSNASSIVASKDGPRHTKLPINAPARAVAGDGKGPFKPNKTSKGDLFKVRAPFSVASSSFAPAITSTAAAHAVAPRRFQSITAATLEEEEDDGEDVLSTLMRKSGVDPGRKNFKHFSAVPGFPLNHESFADDARSNYSASSRMPRSESFSTSETHLISAQRAGTHRGGLETSAEAFRRMRGEGTILSRANWMPDESVRECRECQSYFTPLRRKHHCRICGLVYCSRCASHILPGSRFGLDRADVRVCNFCLRVMSEYERAGRHANDRQVTDGLPHSGGSPQRIATSFARKRAESGGLSRPDKGMISSPLEAQSQTPQSQFAANQLFSTRSGADGSALALAQAVPRMDSLQDMLNELEQEPRAKTALMTSKEHLKEETGGGAVPFRVKMSDEDKLTVLDDDIVSLASSGSPQKISHAGGAIDRTLPKPEENIPKVKAREIRKNLGNAGTTDARERVVGDAALKALRKSKLRARENAVGSINPGIFPSGRRDSLPGAFGVQSTALDSVALRHISILTEKLLSRADIPRAEQWKQVLESLIEKVIKRVHPRPKIGESMDIRQYIKFKRIPGGSIDACDYVNGFVLSKQVATKRMARLLPVANPRVMVVAFPIDFHRAEDHFMSLEPVLAQEHEYTRILVARIVQLRPNVLVVKDSVSRLALDMLEEAGILVVWNLKMSAVQAISRCCQADIITSIERIALEPRLGRCSELSVETFQLACQPKCRKSLMRFTTSGNARSLGCSIILRGSNLQLLGLIKQMMSLLVFAAHNLRLEAQLNRDEGAQSIGKSANGGPCQVGTATDLSADVEQTDSDDLWKRILGALEPFKHSTLSSSAGMLIPPPYQLLKMKEAHKRLKVLEQDDSRTHTSTKDNEQTSSNASDQNTNTSAELVSLEKKSMKESETPNLMLTLEDVMPRPSDLQTEYSRALVEHQLFLKDWSQSTQKDPTTSLQRISVLWTMTSASTHKPCIGPRLITTSFYGQGDETLGQYLERTCSESSTLCPAKGCARPRGMHYSAFVHNDTRVQVVVERFVCPIPGQENNILMWSYCKRCERATPVTPMSEDTWALSFAKYLELHFYDGNKRTTMCGHDFYADFVRFFSLQNLALRFHRDREIIVRDVVLPPMRLLTRPDVDYRLKLDGAKVVQQRITAYWKSVFDRMAALRKEPCLSAQRIMQLETAMKSAHEDEQAVTSYFIETTRSSSQTDILILNKARGRLQESVVRWDRFFQDFERSAFPSERDVRRLTSHQLSSVFSQERNEGNRNTGSRGDETPRLAPPAEAEEDAAGTEPATLASSPVRDKETVELAKSASTPSNMNALAGALMSLQGSGPAPSAGDDLTKFEECLSDSRKAGGGRIARNSREKDEQAVENTKKVDNLSSAADIDTSEMKSGSSDTESSASRPALRRGRTADEIVRSNSARSRRMTSPRISSPSSGLPSSPSSVRRSGAPIRRGPPSSFRPPKNAGAGASSGIETESEGNLSTASNVQHRRKLSIGKRKGRLQVLDAGKQHDGQPKSPKIGRPSSRGPATNTRVSSLARRFDNMQKEAERERERQRMLRARRARPVLASQPTIQVYRNLREAVRDEESDSSEEGSEGQEAEDEADSDGEQRHKHPKRDLQRSYSSRSRLDAAEETSQGKQISCTKVDYERNEAKPAAREEDSAIEQLPTAETADEQLSEAKDASSVDKRTDSATTELTMSSFLSGTIPASWRASLLSDSESSDGRGSLLKALSSLWARESLHLPPIELPMRTTEHLFTDSPLVVLREDEPSSLIAFTLSSTAYAARLEALHEGKSSKKEGQQKSEEEAVESVDMPEKPSMRVDVKGIDIAATLRKTEGTHLNFQFSSGDSSFSIRVLFTEQFDAMRRTCDPANAFVQSLSRCSNWVDVSGGKSGVAMMKTLDDRFVIKQLTRAEMDAFASNAGAYFRFLADVLFQDRPTTLAKIYGVYRLTIRNSQTGRTIKLDCAIAENVFANAQMAQTYDLKGALRNRFVQPNGQPNQVLLDGNLITAKTPIYLREGSKRLLREALFHDSLFLANCDVMDYSLVVGVCEGTAELRVGIIDFIRTFTFGKKAESFLKEAVGGGGAEAPTIIDPKQYRARFLSFLESVLLLSPDHWLSDEEVQAQQSANTLPATTAALHTTQTPAPPSSSSAGIGSFSLTPLSHIATSPTMSSSSAPFSSASLNAVNPFSQL